MDIKKTNQKKSLNELKSYLESISNLQYAINKNKKKEGFKCKGKVFNLKGGSIETVTINENGTNKIYLSDMILDNLDSIDEANLYGDAEGGLEKTKKNNHNKEKTKK